ncbi:hypothetical protein GCM10027034_03850 [Ramlibacter solisilvae]|uniref:Ig-like domain-containing protein n=1 Tax=Ramlibacter tataouinensis TaxID=94132 RepID=UPI00077809F3|nr:Ig-like domain-containing protein [Ramlibacter tataouinensis]
MALFEAFHTPSDADPLAGTLTVADAGLIQIVAGMVTFNYYGNFIYDGDGDLVGGTHTGFEMYDGANGGLQARITGLNIDAITFFSTLAWGNAEAVTQLWFSGNDTLIGSPGDDFLEGYAGADSISAGAGNDLLEGADDATVDTLVGGLGDDIYGVGGTEHASNDIVIESAGAGHDAVVSLTSYVLPANVEDLLLLGSGNSTGWGNELDNALEGNAGSNLLEGLAGNDTLDGGAGGIDTLRGGAGNDTYLVSSSVTVIQESPGGGIDSVSSSVSFTLAAEVENLLLTGSAQLAGHGNALANVITGNNAGDTLDGGLGADTLNGGTGNDLFLVDALGDVINDAGGDDTVRSSIDGYVLGAPGIENLELAGTAASASGNASHNRITGNALANLLYGQGGNDTLEGGAGADTLVGGEGDDTYIVDGFDTTIELAGGGTDVVFSAVSYTLGSQVESLVLTTSGKTGTGNALGNSITGSNGADTLDGGAGADTLSGGFGADSYIVDNAGDTILESGIDADTVFASASYDLGNAPDVESLTLTGSANINGKGNAAANVIVGNSGDNVLTAVVGGFGGGDTLMGGAGRDTLIGSWDYDLLDGGAGADSMAGGTGRDVYVVDDAGDVVIEDASFISGGEGDVIHAWVSYTLAFGVEFMTLMGNGAINGTGSAAGGETITGNEAANVLSAGGGFNDDLYGLGGDDTLSDSGGYARMYGGAGNDTYLVGGSLYWIVENSGEGIDTVRSVVDFTLGNHIENLVLLNGISATGNNLDNVITGNALGNFIDGKGGADTMQGGLGDDQYYVDSDDDVVIELDGQGYDSIVTFGIGIDLTGTSIERVYGEQSGTADFDITGNASDNFLRGSDGRNVIDGGAGADEMYGYLGDDIYVVDNVGDQAVEWAGLDFGTDWVWSKLATYVLPDSVENLKLIASALSGTGNTAANLLQGNAGNNGLDGGGGNDTLQGGLGDDTLTGGAGNDVLDGDAGDDRAVYAGQRADYGITQSSGNITITGGEGTDVLTGVDAIVFADQVLTLNTHFATGTVAITGTAKEGRTLAAVASSVTDADGVGNLSFQWFRGDAAIAGATSASYKAAEDDVGLTLSVRVRFVDGSGNTETLWSAGTDAVVAGDHTPPTVQAFSPADEATGVAPDANVTVTFSEAIVLGTGAILLKKADGTLVESFDVGSSGRITVAGDTLTLDPTALLDYFTDYRVEFAAGNVTDVEGNAYAGTASYNFRTMVEPDTTAPAILAFVPTQGGASVPVTSNFVLLFSEAVQRGAGTIVLKTAGGTVLESFDVATSNRLTIDGDSMIIDPTVDLVAGTSYRFEVSAGAFKDAAGNGVAASGPYAFKTTAVSINGSTGNDSLAGSPGGDQIQALDGNDTFVAGAGSDTLDGGAGLDVAVYSGSLGNFTVTHVANGFTVASKQNPDDVDTLVNVERLVFDDFKVALDISGTAGQAYRLYQAAFDRVPDLPGLGYQMHDLDIGHSLLSVAGNFIASPEFQNTYGNLADRDYITQLYRNVLNREPEPEGMAFYLDWLSKGATRAHLLVGFSESPENQANVIGAIQDGMAYIW